MNLSSGNKKKLNFLYSPKMVVLLFVLLIFLSKGVYGIYTKYSHAKNIYNLADERLKSTEARKRTLDSEIARLHSEDGIEAEIREKYRMAKNGEKLIVIVEKKASEVDQTETPPGLWERFVAVIKDF